MNSHGRWWPLLIMVLLAGGAGANIALMVIAGRDPSFAVEPDYYQKALRWDQAMSQESENAALGWSVRVAVDPTTPGAPARIVVQVTDRDGEPIDGASVQVSAFHNARASRVLAASLAPDRRRGRYSAPLDFDRAGLWELRLRVEQGDRLFTQTVSQDLPRMP